MRIGHVVPVLVKRYLNPATRKRAVFLKGKSGIGKSQTVQQAADLLAQHIPNWQGVIDLRLSQMEPTDLRGIPVEKEGRTHWLSPSFLPKPGTCGFILFDELTSAPPSIQAAAYQYILDRKIGEHAIPDGWMIIAAGNMQTDRGVTFQIAAPLLNRMCELTIETTLDDWLAHAITAGVKPEVLSFIKARPDLLHKFGGKGAAIEPFPSPRSWVAVSDALDLDLPQADRVEMFVGDVGHEAATSFEAHLRLWETMPSLDDILNGRPVDVPADLSLQYCVAMGLAARVDETNFDAAWPFIAKLGKELQAMIVKLAYARNKKIRMARAFAHWAAENASIFSMR